jgi:hypothetical protein
MSDRTRLATRIDPQVFPAKKADSLPALLNCHLPLCSPAQVAGRDDGLSGHETEDTDWLKAEEPRGSEQRGDNSTRATIDGSCAACLRYQVTVSAGALGGNE